MNRVRRRRIRIAAGLLAVGSLALPLGCGTLAEAVLFSTGDEPLPRAGTVLDPGWRVVEYDAEGGVTLRGALLRGAGAGPRPTLVWFHGKGDCAAYNLPRAAVVAESGLDVFVAEYRGFGGCDGSPSEAGLIADGRAALLAVERETGTPSPEVIIVGISLGTGVAAALAEEGHGRAVTLIAPYTSIQEVAGEWLPGPLARWCVPDVFDSLTRLKRSRQPVLVIHGTEDTGVPFAHGERIARELGARATLLPLEGAGHDDTFDAEHWRRVGRAILAFAHAAKN